MSLLLLAFEDIRELAVSEILNEKIFCLKIWARVTKVFEKLWILVVITKLKSATAGQSLNYCDQDLNSNG